MRMKTTAEMFAPLVAGRYLGSPSILWRQLGRSWYQDDILDITLDCLHDAIDEAINTRDHIRLLVLCDQAEEAGVSPELCNLTRQALRTQYPA
jgi:hypothetical protein